MLLEVSKSNMHDVTLVDVFRNLTGIYKCEVSAGRPSYHTLIQRARMEVVDAPKTDPTIGTEKERVAVGETLRANCTSGASRPASTITWKLNGNDITNEQMRYRIRTYKTPQDDDNEVTRSYVEFKVSSDMFENGRLHLRCMASIADVYRKSADIDVTEDAPLNASITGAASPHSDTASSGTTATASGIIIGLTGGMLLITMRMTPALMIMTASR